MNERVSRAWEQFKKADKDKADKRYYHYKGMRNMRDFVNNQLKLC